MHSIRLLAARLLLFRDPYPAPPKYDRSKENWKALILLLVILLLLFGTSVTVYVRM